MKQDEAVEGVILMRVGEQAQVVLRRVEAMTKELNEHVLPPDVKVVPYYDRQSLIEETTKTVEDNLLRGMLLVLVILGAVPVQRADGADCGGHHSVCAVVFVHLPGLAAHSGQPALHRRHRFRHHRGWRGGHGGEYLPRTGGAPRRRELQRDRRDPRGGARCGAAHLLRHRGDHRGIPSHLRADRAFGTPVPADGRYHVVRAAGVAAVRADAAAGAVLVLPAQAHSRTARGGVRMDSRRIRPHARLVPAQPAGHGGGGSGDLRCLAAADSVHRRRVHAAPGRRRAVGAGDHAVHHLL